MALCGVQACTVPVACADCCVLRKEFGILTGKVDLILTRLLCLMDLCDTEFKSIHKALDIEQPSTPPELVLCQQHQMKEDQLNHNKSNEHSSRVVNNSLPTTDAKPTVINNTQQQRSRRGLAFKQHNNHAMMTTELYTVSTSSFNADHEITANSITNISASPINVPKQEIVDNDNVFIGGSPPHLEPQQELIDNVTTVVVKVDMDDSLGSCYASLNSSSAYEDVIAEGGLQIAEEESLEDEEEEFMMTEADFMMTSFENEMGEGNVFDEATDLGVDRYDGEVQDTPASSSTRAKRRKRGYTQKKNSVNDPTDLSAWQVTFLEKLTRTVQPRHCSREGMFYNIQKGKHTYDRATHAALMEERRHFTNSVLRASMLFPYVNSYNHPDFQLIEDEILKFCPSLDPMEDSGAIRQFFNMARKQRDYCKKKLQRRREQRLMSKGQSSSARFKTQLS